MAEADEMHAIIDLRALRAISRFCGRDFFRHYLCGVCLEITPDAVIYVATDGSHLAAHRAKSSEPNTLLGMFIIPTWILDVLAAYDTGGPNPPYLTRGEAGLRLRVDGDFTIAFQPVDGTFPDWREKAVPASKPCGKPGQFNPKLLADYAELGSELLGGATPFVAHDGPQSPTLIHFRDDDTFGVVMPMRLDDRMAERPAPEWARKPQTEREPDLAHEEAAACR